MLRATLIAALLETWQLTALQHVVINMLQLVLCNMWHSVSSDMITNMLGNIGNNRVNSCCTQDALQAGY